jgi:hypothetical protein
MQADDAIVPVFFFLIVVGGPIAAWIVSRVLAHQERMEMIRHGMAPPPDPRQMRHAARYAATQGWAKSQGVTPPPYQYMGFDPGYYAQRQLRRGIQVAFIGLALLVGLSFIGYRGDGEVVPGPWLLGGLVPLFVGIAQIVSAMLSGARFTMPGMANRQDAGSPFTSEPQPPPQAGASSSNMPPPPGSYGAWRPGPTPEIEKPVPPPDRF